MRDLADARLIQRLGSTIEGEPIKKAVCVRSMNGAGHIFDIESENHKRTVRLSKNGTVNDITNESL